MTGPALTLILLSIAATVGTVDVAYFHLYRFRLATRPESRRETATHVVRGLTMGAIALLLALGDPAGGWFWVVAALFAVDLTNSVVDTFLEADSRAALGGLPRLESMIHVVGATLMGAATVSFVALGAELAVLDTAVLPTETPAWLRTNGGLIAVGAWALAAFETVTALVSARRLQAARA